MTTSPWRIDDVYKFEVGKQKGKSDGFFIFKNTIIFYDCTLDPNYEENKRVQIDNFCAQLKKDNIQIDKKTMTIRSFNKRVWIITNNKARLIGQFDDIKVKEVPVSDLIRLYLKRMNLKFDSESLEKELLDV